MENPRIGNRNVKYVSIRVYDCLFRLQTIKQDTVAIQWFYVDHNVSN